MSKTVGNIVVQLQANSASFNRDMAKARRQVGSTAAGINKSLAGMERGFNSVRARSQTMLKSIFSLRNVVGGLTGATGLGLMAKRSLESADAIAKTANKIGLSTTALQQYQFAAGQSGIQTKTLNMAMQRFTRRVAEAAQGKGELKDVLKQYGIAVKDASGRTRDINDILGDLAEVIKNTDDKSERLRITFKAFDSEGAVMVNMLSAGRRGLKDYAAEATRLGIVLDDKLLQNAVKANDALDKMGRVLQATFTKVVAENADSLAEAVENLASAMSKVASFAGLRSVTNTELEGLKLVREGELDYYEFINAGFRERQKLVDGVIKKQQQLYKISAHEGFRLNESTRGVPTGGAEKAEILAKQYTKAFNDAVMTYSGDIESPAITAARLSGMEFEHQTNSIKTTPQVVRQVRNEAEILAKQYTEAFNDAVMTYSGNIESPGLTAARLSRMEFEHQTNSIKTALDDFYTDIDAAELKTQDATAGMAESFGTLSQSIDSATNTMGNAFAEFVTTGRLDFKKMAVSIIADLIRIQARAAAMQIFSTIGGAVAGAVGGAVGGSTAAAVTLQSGGYIGESVVGVGRKSGRSYEFHPNEFVIPADQIMRRRAGLNYGGGAVNNFNIAIQAPEGRLPRASLNQLQAAIAAGMARQSTRNSV